MLTEDADKIVEQINRVREERERFITERVSSPNPVITYSRAKDMRQNLLDGELKDRLTTALEKAWSNVENVTGSL